MRMRSRFTYGATTWDTTLPARAWTPGDSTVGGVRVSAAGVPASYVVRRDALLNLTLRVLESEWEDLLALIAWGQSAESFAWVPDVEEDPLTGYEVYLEGPKSGENWSPTRDGDYPRVMEVSLVLRGVSLAPWMPYFP